MSVRKRAVRGKVSGRGKNIALRKYLTIVGSIVSIFILVGFVAAYGYIQTANEAAKPYLLRAAQEPGEDAVHAEAPADVPVNEDDSGFMLPPRKTNVLLICLDGFDLLSDALMVATFDRETCKIDLVSIPRDTYVTLSKQSIKELQEAGRHPPSSGIMKINAVTSYAGKELGTKYMQQTVEELLGVKMDYYAEISIDAFHSIVDAVDGVDFEVPAGGLYYDDPEQGLHIALPGGMQNLNGKEAEGLVRYRATYRRGDLQRIEVQQAFMKAMFSQVLNKEAIMNNALSFITTIITYVSTDFPITDLPKYIKYINKLNSDNLETHTLPGEAQTINGASYFIHDPQETMELVDKLFYSSYAEEEGEANDAELSINEGDTTS